MHAMGIWRKKERLGLRPAKSKYAAPGAAAVTVGAALPLAFAPWSWWWLAPACLALLFSLVRQASPGRAFLLGYAFGLGLFGVGVSWIHVSITRYGGGGWLAGFAATGGLVAFLALFPALALGMSRLLRPRADAWALWVTMPGAWVALEWLRTWIFTGFPWLLLGYSQVDSPLAVALAPIGGVLGLSLTVCLGAAALVWCGERRRKRYRLVGLLVLLLLAVPLLQWITRDWTEPAGPPLRVAVVQGNFDQAEKWRPENRALARARYAELSEPLWQGDLMVWPETAIPELYENLPAIYRDSLARHAKDNGSALVMGALTRRGGRLYNSAIVVESGAVYDKRHLVPFGEYVPLRGLFGDTLDVLGAPQADFNAGSGDAHLPVAGYRAAIAICYEIIFGADVAAVAEGSALLITMSNDAWFGDSVGPHQHLQIARLRAMETQRPLLRATNTGISMIVDHRGRPLASAPQFQPAVATASISPRRGSTPYMRWRDIPLLWVLALCSLLLWFRRKT